MLAAAAAVSVLLVLSVIVAVINAAVAVADAYCLPEDVAGLAFAGGDGAVVVTFTGDSCGDV